MPCVLFGRGKGAGLPLQDGGLKLDEAAVEQYISDLTALLS